MPPTLKETALDLLCATIRRGGFLSIVWLGMSEAILRPNGYPTW